MQCTCLGHPELSAKKNCLRKWSPKLGALEIYGHQKVGICGNMWESWLTNIWINHWMERRPNYWTKPIQECAVLVPFQLQTGILPDPFWQNGHYKYWASQLTSKLPEHAIGLSKLIEISWHAKILMTTNQIPGATYPSSINVTIDTDVGMDQNPSTLPVIDVCPHLKGKIIQVHEK